MQSSLSYHNDFDITLIHTWRICSAKRKGMSSDPSPQQKHVSWGILMCLHGSGQLPQRQARWYHGKDCLQ
eukprot:602694-Pelagomonas_calceolata.AAC.7